MRERKRRGVATAFSAALHGALVLAAWGAAGAAKPPTPMKVYRVDIVSPPPNVAGAPPAEAPSGGSPPVPEPATAAPEPEPEAAPEPIPAPPTSKPKPPEPRPTPKAEEPKPAPRTPVRPALEKKETPAPKPPPAEAARPKAAAPAPAPEKPRAAPSSTTAQAERNRATPATGREPVASSAGGEGLSVRTEGARCPSEQYCNNIVRQVKRYFRRPAEARADRGDVCFRIGRSGTVDDIGVERLRGSAVFKLALMEAVEQASLRKEFGSLPEAFGSDWLDVCVEVSPSN